MTKSINILWVQEKFSPIERARGIVESETEEICAERDAFDSFRRSVRSFQTQGPQVVSDPLTIQNPSNAGTMADIRNTYLETVMSTAHHESVYSESLIESLTAEFGPELAKWLSTESPVTPQLKSLLLGAIDECYRNREQLLKAIETEDDSLSDSYSALVTAVDDGDLSASETNLTTLPESLERTCERVVAQRQEIINTRQSFTRLDGHDLCTYLYREAPWTYPVLSSVTSLLDRFGTEDCCRPDRN